ncbi:DUF3892 domain-containing protein [Aminipila sp.]|uniref:DUF3892 domain-containing protein n=1 Tax=Aminipila sp. TaxID=2060095 RepID=UPI00289D72A8|nr:DUF3892 domain-containing protein [Aminipila sp.]
MDNTSKIIKIRKNEDGEITDVMLENKTILPINHAILMAKEGLIDGTIVMRGKNGGEFLRNDPNSSTIAAISDLPTFK